MNKQKLNLSDTGIVAEGSTPQLISKGFSFTEGPATDKQGNIFFTDQPNDKIWKYGIDGKLSLFMDKTGRSNGMYFDKKGSLLSCADEENQIWSISKTKKVTVLLNDVEGKKLNGPNDLWVAPNGDIYFTDPYYQRSYWKRTKAEMKGEYVYLLPHGKKEAIPIITNLEQPNGIVGTPDGKWLYVADIKANKTYRYVIGKNGLPGDGKLFAPLGSDGMTLDNKGNVYLTFHNVTVFDVSGKKIATIPIAEQTTNVAFGGKQKDHLFITAKEAIYTLQMKVHGVE